jgi:hypothetical protein
MLAVAALVLTGCLVSPPDLTDHPFPCDNDQDCIDGWACADIGVLGHDVCRPRCDPSNPAATCAGGFCNSAGACWDTCSIASDGALDHACTGGLTCVRRNGFTGEGLCMPTAGCSVTSDCIGANSDCLNSVFQLPSSGGSTTFSADHAVCIATPEEDRCPAGYFSNNGICIPSCDQTDDRCPPGMACIKGLGSVLGAGGRSACLIGWRGLPCRDDSECYEGRCLTLASGLRTCSFTCAQADAAGTEGCDILDGYPIAGFGGLDFECDTAGMCAPHGAVGAPCNEGMPCHSEIACLNETGGVCTSQCTRRADCVVSTVDSTPQREQVYCAPISTPTGGMLTFCLNQRPVGSACETSAQCTTGRCASSRCVFPVNPP